MLCRFTFSFIMCLNNAQMVIFNNNTVLRWMEESKITSVAWCHGRIFLGNNLGQIFSFKSPSISTIVNTNEKNKIKVSKNPIVNISSLEPREELLAQDSEGDLFIVNIFLKTKPVILCKKVSCFTRQAIEGCEEVRSSDKILPITYMANICVGLKQKIQIYSAIGENVLHQRDISISDIPLTICWLNDTIVIGTSTSYSMTNAEGTVYTELCRNDLSTDRRLQKPSPPKNIITCTCIDNDVMIVCDNIGVFYNVETMNLSNKNTIQWSGTLESLGSCPPFIVGLTSKKKLEIHGIRDQLLYKTLDLRTSAITYFMPDKCNFLCATSTIVTAVQPSSYYENISNFLENDKIKEALQLVNLYFSQNDQRKKTEIAICHTIAGWIYFSKLNFPVAFLHFSYGNVDIVYLLSFWSQYYPLEVPETYQFNKEIPQFLHHLIPKTLVISKFVENKINDPEFNKYNQIENTKKELLELANSSFALFLFRNSELREREKEGEMAEFYKKVQTAVETVTFLLFSESDDLRYNHILRKDKNSSFVDVDATKNHLIDMDKSDLYAKLLIRDGRLIEAMGVLSDLVTSRNVHSHHNLEGGSDTPCIELASCINLVLDSVGKNKNSELSPNFTPEETKEILYTYLPLLFESSPSSALNVLTKNHTTLPLNSDEILSMINEHCKKSSHGHTDMPQLQIKYLEDLVLKNKSGGVHENTLLVKYYIQSLSSTQGNFSVDNKQGFESQNDRKQALFQLLEGNYTFDLPKIENLICSLDMPEARVILYSKLGKHYQALETIYTKWVTNQVKLCEAYCLCFGDITKFDQLNKDNPYKRLFTYYDYWIEKAEEWPLADTNLYIINQESETSIDNLIMDLLKIIVSHTDTENKTTITKHLISKYIHFCGYNSSLNGTSLLEVIPGDWNFNEFANLFNHLQLRMLHSQRTKSVKKGLARSLHSKTSLSLYKLTSLQPVRIDTNTLCMVCSEPIKIGTSIAIKIPPQKDTSESNNSIRQPLVVHEYCIRKGHMS
uniref:CNH domain/Region in Clathrin and VPS/Vacuolar sorting protein 39 domain 2, putative n=1 Tax=Theileria annulata TaxID=5874 RepID=A0A3B0N636_THEAN